MTTSLVDAFDLVAHAEVLEQRLLSVAIELEKRANTKEEQMWVHSAHAHLARAREGIGKLLTRALRLDELEPVRAERGRVLQGAVVDALEQLHEAIGLAGGPRSPLFEVLYSTLKLAPLRRCHRDDFEKACDDFEKRLGSSYAKRMLSDPDYTAVRSAVEKLLIELEDWRGVFGSTPLEDTEAAALRAEVEAAAERLEVPTRQARLLAEAALVGMEDVAASSGVLEKPKRRAGRLNRSGTDSPPANALDAHDTESPVTS